MGIPHEVASNKEGLIIMTTPFEDALLFLLAKADEDEDDEWAEEGSLYGPSIHPSSNFGTWPRWGKYGSEKAGQSGAKTPPKEVPQSTNGPQFPPKKDISPEEQKKFFEDSSTCRIHGIKRVRKPNGWEICPACVSGDANHPSRPLPGDQSLPLE